MTCHYDQYLLEKALRIASVWDGNKAVGIDVLWGDGRFYARIDTLLVDKEYRKSGIATELVQVLVNRVNALCPHYCEHDTHLDWMVKFYQRFGFEISEGPWFVKDIATAVYCAVRGSEPTPPNFVPEFLRRFLYGYRDYRFYVDVFREAVCCAFQNPGTTKPS